MRSKAQILPTTRSSKAQEFTGCFSSWSVPRAPCRARAHEMTLLLTGTGTISPPSHTRKLSAATNTQALRSDRQRRVQVSSPNGVYTTEALFGLCRGQGRHRLAARLGKLFTAASPCSFHLTSEPSLLKGHAQGGPGKHPHPTSPSAGLVLLLSFPPLPQKKNSAFIISRLQGQPQNCISQMVRTEAKGKGHLKHSATGSQC